MKTHVHTEKKNNLLEELEKEMTFFLCPPAGFVSAESESGIVCRRTIQTYKRKRDRERIQRRRQNAMCQIILAIMDSGRVTCVHMHSYLYLYTLVRR